MKKRRVEVVACALRLERKIKAVPQKERRVEIVACALRLERKIKAVPQKKRRVEVVVGRYSAGKTDGTADHLYNKTEDACAGARKWRI